MVSEIFGPGTAGLYRSALAKRRRERDPGRTGEQL